MIIAPNLWLLQCPCNHMINIQVLGRPSALMATGALQFPPCCPSSAASSPVLQPATTVQISSCLPCLAFFRPCVPTGLLLSSSCNLAWPMGGSCWPHQAFFPQLLASFSKKCAVFSNQCRKSSESFWGLL